MLLLLLCAFVVISPHSISAQAGSKRVVCFYDHKAHSRPDSGKFEITDLERACTLCTHVIYGYAKLDGEDYKLEPIDKDFDTVNYKSVTALKPKCPNVKFLLSVGGWRDNDDKDHPDKYTAMLRDPKYIRKFISSVVPFLEKYGFDGIDLAWQFPLVRQKERSTLGGVWHKIKKTVGAAEGSEDPLAAEHKAGFTSLIKQLKLALRPDGLWLTTSVIPHTNYTTYYDTKEIHSSLDAIHLHSFDFLTAEDKISPKVADFPAPLYAVPDRNPVLNVDYQVTWFLTNGFPSNKLILGIPTFGRTWEIEEETKTGAPPVAADGPGDKEHLTKQKGLLSYAELCTLAENYAGNSKNTPGVLRVVSDPVNRRGTFSYRNEKNDKDGIWAGHEDLLSAGFKGSYAKSKNLGGIAIVDITTDDFRGMCTGDRFPLLRAARAQI